MCFLGRRLGLEYVDELMNCRPFTENRGLLLNLAHPCRFCGEVFMQPGLLQYHQDRLHKGGNWEGPAERCPQCHCSTYYP